MRSRRTAIRRSFRARHLAGVIMRGTATVMALGSTTGNHGARYVPIEPSHSISSLREWPLCLHRSGRGVFRFRSETGQTDFLADSLERWADRVLSDHRVETGWPLAHEWQAARGPLLVSISSAPLAPGSMRRRRLN